ncbi:MAG TPA: copper chaperone PCu(A)C [Fontimonas sp.]
MTAFRSALFLSGALLAACKPAADGPALSASEAWVRAAPPGVTVMAGYATLRNNGDQPVRCDAVSGKDFGAAEIHRTVIEDGDSRMLRDQVLEVPPGKEAAFAPGSFHLMLFRPQRLFAVGDVTHLVLRCGEQQLGVDFQIRNPS